VTDADPDHPHPNLPPSRGRGSEGDPHPNPSPSNRGAERKSGRFSAHPAPSPLAGEGGGGGAPRVVVCAAPEHLGAARAVATSLRLPLAARPDEGELALVLDERGWMLLDPRTPREGGAGSVRCDLLEGGLGARLAHGASGEGRLARALGLKRHPGPRVLDATAGLGRDTVVAAALGCEVIACERSPVVALLLRDGLTRAVADPALAPLIARIRVEVADAREFLEALPEAERPDVVLLDPMFPERRKTARAKGEMQLLQMLLGAPPVGEDTALLEAALAHARRRVVVKRPAHALAIGGARQPDLEVPGRAARYDVYVIAG